jgi:predicted DNA binding CopG/RHH family protein
MCSSGEPKRPSDLLSDEDAERFVAEEDLSGYDLSGFTPVHFEFGPERAHVSVPLPATLLEAVMRQAEARGMPYQRFIREAIERALKEEPPA